MYTDVIKKWEKGSGRSFDSIMDVKYDKNGKVISKRIKDPQLKLALQEWKKLTKQVGKDIIDENIIIKDATTGEKRLFGEDDLLDVYFRRIITPEFRDLLIHGGQHESVKAQLAEQLIMGSGDKSLMKRFTQLKKDSQKRNKKAQYSQSKMEELMGTFFNTFETFARFQENGPLAGNIENFRKLNLKNNVLNIDGKEYKVFRDDFSNVAKIWIEQSGNYKHAVGAYGQNMEKAGLMLAALRNSTRNPADVEFAKRAIEWQVGLGKEISETLWSKGMESGSRGLTGFVAWTALSAPPSGLKNLLLGQSANVGSFGTLNSIHGTIDMLLYNPSGKTITELFSERGLSTLNVRKNLKDSFELARRSGAIMSGQRSLELSQLAGGNLKKWNPGGMYPTEGGYYKVWTHTRANGLLEDYFGMSPGMINKAVKRYKTWGTYSNDLQERASYHGQAKTQGSTSVPHMPAWVQKHPNVARPLSIFQRMAYRAAYNIKDGVLKPVLQGNVLPLVRYGVATGLSGKALWEFTKFFVGESGGMKAETEQNEWKKAQEYFMKAEGLAIITGVVGGEGFSHSFTPATASTIKDGLVSVVAAIRGNDQSWRQSLEKNFENIAFWRFLNRTRENIRAKGYEYGTDAIGVSAVKLLKAKGKTVEGAKFKTSKRLARNLQYDFAEKAGYEKKDSREQSATDWVESNSPYYKDVQNEIFMGNRKDIARVFDAAFIMIQTQEENNGVKSSQARKTAISRMKTFMKRQAPVTLSRSSYGRQQSKYKDFHQSLLAKNIPHSYLEGKLIIKDAEKDWRERKLFINEALRRYSSQYRKDVFNFNII